MNTSSMTEADWAAELDSAYPTETAPKPAQPPQSEEPALRVRTADEILAEDNAQAKARKATVPTKNGNHTSAADTGVVYADDHAGTPAPEPTTPSTSTSPTSPEVVELLRRILAELRSLCALVATGVNKLPSRK